MHKTALNRRISLISLVSHKNNPKHYRNYFDCFFHAIRRFDMNLKFLVIALANHRFAKQSVLNITMPQNGINLAIISPIFGNPKF